MPKFNVGDVVTMSEVGKRHMCIGEPVSMSGLGDNPWGIPGVVNGLRIGDSLPVVVNWANGEFNYYNHDDLEFFNLSLENK